MLAHAIHPSIMIPDWQRVFVQAVSKPLRCNEECRQLVFMFLVIPIAGILK